MRLFSEEHPALFFGLSALLGSLLYFEHAWVPVIAWTLLLFFISWKRALLQIGVVLLFHLYCAHLFSSPPIPGAGKAVFAIHSVQRHRSPFSSGWIYKGELRAFESQSGHWPCTIVTHGERQKAASDYFIDGELFAEDRFTFGFKPKEWKPIAGTWSLAEIRFQAKEGIRSLLHRKMTPKAADFLAALFTGEVDDRMLRFEFGRLGLQHILAISGFHFALVAAFAALLLRPICPYRPRLIALLATATLYFLLVGNSPPVLRSFLAAALFLSGRLLQRRSSSLNLLGAGLLFEIALDPLSALSIGFQLSFLSCGAILLLNAPIRCALSFLLPKRSLRESAALPPLSQFAYAAISFFTRALSLTLAVNLALLPLLLYHFHRFPLLSLLYNLFIPPLSALSLLLLLPAFALHPLSPLLALPFFKLSGFLADELLEIVAYPPAVLDAALSGVLPGWTLAPWLSILFLVGIYFQHSLLHFSPFSSKKDVHFNGGRSSAG